MGWFDWLPWRKKGATMHADVQTRSGGAHPFGAIRQYIPNQVNVTLYKQLREAVPTIDVGIQNLRRLIGVPKIRFPNQRKQKEWDTWQRAVKVGKTGKGLGTFVSMYTDTLIQNGFSAGEILPTRGKNDIYALIPIDGEIIVVKETEDPTEFILAEKKPMEPEPVPYQIPEWIIYNAYEASPSNPYGRGIMTGLPFLADILLTIFYATGRNWERFGDLKYSLDFNIPEGIDPQQAKEFIEMAKQSWVETMQKTRDGKVQDFMGTNVKVSVIGADAKQLDMQVPVRTILEQIVAKTGLPPFVFGFAWSARESMTKTQADILTSIIDDWREMITPAVTQIAEWWCRFRGYPMEFEIEWNEVSLQDIEGLANAELTMARAENQRLQNVLLARDLQEQGYLEPDVVNEMVEAARPKGIRTKGKRVAKDSSDADVDPARLQQKIRDTQKIDQIAALFEEQVIEALANVRQRLYSFMERNATKGMVSSKSIDLEQISKVVEEELEVFLVSVVNEVPGLAFYDSLLRSAALAAFDSAVEDIRTYINSSAMVRSSFNFSDEYVRTLRDEGMDLVKTKVKDMKQACIDIMERHASVGDNPVAWANSLQRELGEQLDQPRWYWRRLARSEAAMMFDRAAEEEYAAQEMEYVKWVIAPDACPKCRVYANKVFPLRESPQVVKDTHPHCRCRKMAVTTATAEEIGVTTFTRKEVKNLERYLAKNDVGACGCRHKVPAGR